MRVFISISLAAMAEVRYRLAAPSLLARSLDFLTGALEGRGHMASLHGGHTCETPPQHLAGLVIDAALSSGLDDSLRGKTIVIVDRSSRAHSTCPIAKRAPPYDE